MKKTVKIGVLATDIRLTEALPSFIANHEEEFKDLNFINHTRQKNNAICIYCENGYEDRYYSKEYQLKTVITIDNDIFFDWDGSNPHKDNDSNGILFKDSNGKRIAYFNPDKEMLVTCNMTHKEVFLSVAKEVFEEIFSVLKDMGYDPHKMFKIKRKKLTLQSIGTDPEFDLKLNGKSIPAYKIYNDTETEIGSDGSGTQLELRPKAGTPKYVINNLYNLLKEASNNRYDIGFSDEYSYGGHIHFGYGTPTIPNKNFLKVLDNFLGKPTRNLLKRRGYGRISEYRLQNWGFEYRTPSSAIFTTPNIAEISLKIACILGEKAANSEEISYNDELNPTIEDYRKLGLTSEEAEEFVNFTKMYKPPVSILGFWKIEAPNVILVYFSDEWKDEVRNVIIKHIKSIKVSKPIDITLFGLKKSRGNVNTIEVPSYDVIDHTMSSVTTIGVAWDIRHGTNVELFLEALKAYIIKLDKEVE